MTKPRISISARNVGFAGWNVTVPLANGRFYRAIVWAEEVLKADGIIDAILKKAKSEAQAGRYANAEVLLMAVRVS